METALKMADPANDRGPMIANADYSIYTLRQLLKARCWLDADRSADRRALIEKEIQNRCAYFQQSTKRRGSTATGMRSRYRPYGLMLGVFFIVVSSGPFLTVEFLDAMNFIPDVNGDHALLSGVWAMLTLPFAVMVVLIGGMADAERVVKWLNL